MVGLLAAKLRDLKPPDAYKGKGIRYADEVVRLKVGKSGA
jgi:large subunit ribosomal protein L6